MVVSLGIVASLLERAFREKIIPAIEKEMEKIGGAKVRIESAHFLFSHIEQRKKGSPVYIEERDRRRKVVGYEVQVALVTPLVLAVEGRRRSVRVVWDVRMDVWAEVEAGDPPAVLRVRADRVQVEGSPLRCKSSLLLATTGMTEYSIESFGLPSFNELEPYERDISKVAHYLLLHSDDSWIGLRLIGEKLISAFVDIAKRLGTLEVQNAAGTLRCCYTIERIEASPKIVVDYSLPPPALDLSSRQATTTYTMTYEIEGTLGVRLKYKRTSSVELTLPMTLEIKWEFSEPISPPPAGGSITLNISVALTVRQIPPHHQFIRVMSPIRQKVIASGQRISLSDILPSNDELEKTIKYLLHQVYDYMSKMGLSSSSST